MILTSLSIISAQKQAYILAKSGRENRPFCLSQVLSLLNVSQLLVVNGGCFEQRKVIPVLVVGRSLVVRPIVPRLYPWGRLTPFVDIAFQGDTGNELFHVKHSSQNQLLTSKTKYPKISIKIYFILLVLGVAFQF